MEGSFGRGDKGPGHPASTPRLTWSDGAARVYDPFVRGEAGDDVCGVFLKDYAPASW